MRNHSKAVDAVENLEVTFRQMVREIEKLAPVQDPTSQTDHPRNLQILASRAFETLAGIKDILNYQHPEG